MPHFISLITLLTFAWASTIQAFPTSEFDPPSSTNHHTSLIHNNGDIAKTVESLNSKETLKSITTAMLMAGLSGGGTPSTFMGHVSQQTANALYRIAIESAVYGRADGKGVALSAVAGAIGGKLSAEIGTLNSAGEIGLFTHKVMHALNGAGQGLIVGGEKGMAAGALGATLVVTVAEVMMPTNGIDKIDPKERPPYNEADIQKAQAVSRVVAAMVALGVGMEASDVSIAIMAAITAVDHNCAKSARKAGEDTKDGYNTDDEAEASTAGKGRRAVLKAIGVEKIGQIIDNFAHELGLDQSLQTAATYPRDIEGGEAEYVAAHLKWTEESVFKRPLTADETAVYGATFKHAYAKHEPSIDAAAAFGKVASAAASAIGKGVDVFLRYTGLTDKGTARAVGNSVNDGLAVVGAGAALKGVVKRAAKSVGKGAANSQLPANYEKIISQIPGRVISEADAFSQGPLLIEWQETFSGGRYAVITLDKPLEITRVWAPGQSTEFGACWGIEKASGSLQSCIDKAIIPEWGKIKDTPHLRTRPTKYTTARIPAGEQIYVGEVGSQNGAWVGGTSQVIVKGGVKPAWKINIDGDTLK